MVVSYFNEQRTKIADILHKIPGKASLTSDMWMSTINNDAFLGITIHYIDQQWKFHQFLLDIIHFTTRHTGKVVKLCIFAE